MGAKRTSNNRGDGTAAAGRSHKGSSWQENARLTMSLVRHLDPEAKTGEVFRPVLDDRLCTKYRRKYQETGNPTYAWNAYRLERRRCRDIPDWVLQYLDRVAAHLAAYKGNELDKSATAVAAEALGLKGPGQSGRGTVFSKRAREDNEIWRLYAHHVAIRIKAGDQETYAIEAVAKATGKSKSTIRRYWHHAKAVSFKKSPNS